MKRAPEVNAESDVDHAVPYVDNCAKLNIPGTVGFFRNCVRSAILDGQFLQTDMTSMPERTAIVEH